MKLHFLFFIFISISIFSCKNESPECTELKELYHFIVEDSVTLEMSSMNYACGDCDTYYNVDSVLYSKNNNSSFYYNKEILVEFIKNKLEKKVLSDPCLGRCKKYIFTGYFSRNGFGMACLDVLDGEIFIDKECCEESSSK